MAKKITMLRQRYSEVYKKLGYEVTDVTPQHINRLVASVSESKELSGDTSDFKPSIDKPNKKLSKENK